MLNFYCKIIPSLEKNSWSIRFNIRNAIRLKVASMNILSETLRNLLSNQIVHNIVCSVWAVIKKFAKFNVLYCSLFFVSKNVGGSLWVILMGFYHSTLAARQLANVIYIDSAIIRRKSHQVAGLHLLTQTICATIICAQFLLPQFFKCSI